jgi:uncharacterized protein
MASSSLPVAKKGITANSRSVPRPNSGQCIVTLHRANATGDKLPVMLDWFRYLESIGVTSVRLHILESENEFIRATYGLTTEESVRAFLEIAMLEA